jgi:hypothetical protein
MASANGFGRQSKLTWRERFINGCRMPSTDKELAARPSIWLMTILVVVLHAVPWPPDLLASPGSDVLEVRKEPGGGVRATAHVLFPAKIEVIQALFTDYLHWPELFEVRLKVAELNVRDGVATVDLRIEHSLMPGERRLVTESRTLPDGGLVTDLTGGDFKRYHRIWKLRPTAEGSQTSADFELLFELDSLLPDWLLVLAVRQELEGHFHIVKQKAMERARR